MRSLIWCLVRVERGAISCCKSVVDMWRVGIGFLEKNKEEGGEKKLIDGVFKSMNWELPRIGCATVR